jgi:hypothetical protein
MGTSVYYPAFTFLFDLASRIVKIVQSEAWRSSDVADNQNMRYAFTKQVHRDWLMTPREDLGGRIPRELLHGAKEWSDKVTWGQRLRFEDGAPMTAVPDDVAGYDTAPMGSQEMVLYFDLSRELIGAGWFWCGSDDVRHAIDDSQNAMNRLVDFGIGFWTRGVMQPRLATVLMTTTESTPTGEETKQGIGSEDDQRLRLGNGCRGRIKNQFVIRRS